MGTRQSIENAIVEDGGLLAALRRADLIAELIDDLPDGLKVDLLKEHQLALSDGARLGKAFDAAVAKLPKRVTSERDLAGLVARWVLSRIARSRPGDAMFSLDAMLAHARPIEGELTWRDGLLQLVHLLAVDAPIPAHLREEVVRLIGRRASERRNAQGLEAWSRWYRATWCVLASDRLDAIGADELGTITGRIGDSTSGPAWRSARVLRLKIVLDESTQRLKRISEAGLAVLRESSSIGDAVASTTSVAIDGSSATGEDAFRAWEVMLNRWNDALATALVQLQTPSTRPQLEALARLPDRLRPSPSPRDMELLRAEASAIRARLARDGDASPSTIAPLLSAIAIQLDPATAGAPVDRDVLEDLSGRFLRELGEGKFYLNVERETVAAAETDILATPSDAVSVAHHDADEASAPAIIAPNPSPLSVEGALDPAPEQFAFRPPADAGLSSHDLMGVEVVVDVTTAGSGADVADGLTGDALPSTDAIPIAAPVISTRATPAEPARQVAQDLVHFTAFSAAWWVASNGDAGPAPWTQPGYDSRVSEAMALELTQSEPSFPFLWLLAKALPSPDAPTPSVEDIEAVATLWTQQSVDGLPPSHRGRALAQAYDESTLTVSLRWRLALLLEALRPSDADRIPLKIISELVDFMSFADLDLRAALNSLLRIGSLGEAPTVRIAALLADQAPTVDPSLTLERRRRELYELFEGAQRKRLFRFKTDFCQQPWIEFLGEVHPLIQRLFPARSGGADFDVQQMRAVAASIEARHARHADRAGARHHDRGHMDQAAKRIAASASEVITAQERLGEARRMVTPSAGGTPIASEAFMRLRTRHLARDEEFFRRLIVRVLNPERPAEIPDALGFAWSDLLRCEGLLEVMRPVRRYGIGKDVGSIDLGRAPDVVDVRLAAAAVVDGMGTSAASSREELVARLYKSGRTHALNTLSAALDPADQERIRTAAVEHDDRVHEVASVLGQRIRQLRHAASPLATALASAADEALRLLEGSADRVPPVLPELWVKRLLSTADQEMATCRDEILSEAADREDEIVSRVEPLLEQGRFAEAIAALRGHPAGDTLFRRATRYRAHAQHDQKSLPAFWVRSATTHQAQNSLRVEFSKQILGDELYQGAYNSSYIALPTQGLRKWIDKKGLNPSFLPQLDRRQRLVIVTAGVPSSERTFVTRGTDTAAAYPNDIVVVLAPQITQERRLELGTQLRRRSLMAAVVDDLDMSRLLNTGGDTPVGLLALLEVILEQQSWSSSAPTLAEGQHVQLEMYVGRKDEARRLAMTPAYSRLFSGRKLGKSALLRYVERRFDGEQLPSGLTLRVLYVSAVSIDRAERLVEEIAIHLEKRFSELSLGPPPPNSTPSDRLSQVTQAFITRYPRESLLIVLDEADAFVEHELEEYQRHHEACLSFAMRSRIESERDEHGLSRVRFVFTGYRVTNTRDGAWANWGDVLRLVPLPPQDAADLVAGPLARVGIDASEQAASIAHRSGYQPAVILRFTERLLARLENSKPMVVRQRELTRVSPEDVADVFEDSQVQQEIRLVVQNNFQGNATGGIVFGALVGEFLAAGPRAGVERAEEAIVGRLEILSDGDLGWLRPEGRSARDEILRHLSDFADRQLIMDRQGRGEPKMWYLRFPHHLVLLEPLASEERLRDEIKAVRSRSSPGTRAQTRGFLSPYESARLHGSGTSTEPTLTPVLGALLRLEDADWLVKRGVLEKSLGLSRSQIGDPAEDTRAWYGIRPDQIDFCLQRMRALSLAQANPRPLLVGGVDLLRAALAADERLVDDREEWLTNIGLGRLTRAMVGWWFDAGRGYHFVHERDLDDLYARTSGIPLLVGRLDSALAERDPNGSGLEVSSELARRVGQELDDAVPRLTEALVQGGGALRLERRERELLWMIAQLKGDADVLIDEEWGHLVPNGTAPRYEPYRESTDRLSLMVLQHVGLVPVVPDRAPGLPLQRLGVVDAHDALHRIVATMK